MSRSWTPRPSAPASGRTSARRAGHDVLLAAEIERPESGSWKIVHETKVRDYARSGIPHYWIIDLYNIPVLTAYELATDGTYVQRHSVQGWEKIEFTEPFPVTLAPAEVR